jgi:nitrogen-specific signal transduction histidine kinase
MARAGSRSGVGLHTQVAAIALLSLLIGVGAGFVVIVICTHLFATPRGLWSTCSRVLWQTGIVMICATFASLLTLVRIWSRRRVSVMNPTPTWVGMSHDLRAPLTRLRLRAERVDPDLREGMLREIDRMGRLIDLTLQALKHETGMEPMENVNIATLIETVCDEFADVGHRVSYTGPTRLTAVCAPDSLSRALANIIDNATKHAEEVTVELRLRNESQLEIVIADNGPGMSASTQVKAFEPFERGHANVHAEGFGLGLSIARDIVQVHGGDIQLHNREPHGLLVQVSLPRDYHKKT